MGFGTQKTQRQRARCLARRFVGYVKHRRHLVAILCCKAARRKLYVVDQLRIDETQTFLLSRADEERTVDFDAIHIDEVFVEIAATHTVLGT